MDYENYKILVVDDHMLSRTLLGQQLGALGFKNIQFCVNGEEGLAKLAEEKFDIVFMDWSMPVMDGLTFLKACREKSALKTVAFVMVSAEAGSGQVMEAIKAGATSYITKPVSMSDLKDKTQKIVEWCEKHR